MSHLSGTAAEVKKTRGRIDLAQEFKYSQLSGTTVDVERTRGRIDLAQALKLPHLVRTGQFHLRRKEDPLRAKLEPLEEHFRELTSTCIPLEKNSCESICITREKKCFIQLWVLVTQAILRAHGRVVFGFFLFMYVIQYCFICRPSNSTMSENAGIEPRTVATTAVAVRRSNHSATSIHPHFSEFFVAYPDFDPEHRFCIWSHYYYCYCIGTYGLDKTHPPPPTQHLFGIRRQG